MSFNSAWCYETSNRDVHTLLNRCLIIDDIDSWDKLSLFWNLRSHFVENIFFVPTFVFQKRVDKLVNFLWDTIKEYQGLTAISHSLTTDEMVELFKLIPSSELVRERERITLRLKKNNAGKTFIIDMKKPTNWTDPLGKIKVAYGRSDQIPTYFSEFGGTVGFPEGKLFSSNGYAMYAIDFEIPYLKPPVSSTLRYLGLGVGGSTRISSIGLTSLRGGMMHEEDFIPLRALDSMTAISEILEDYGFKTSVSSNGDMAARFLTLLKGIDHVTLLSGEDVVNLLKTANPLFRDQNDSTVKKPDEDAAIGWGKVQQYLNVGSEAYITKKFAEKLVSWMISNNLLRIGAVTKCENCHNKQWMYVDQLKDRVQCNACFSELQLPLKDFHHLEWNYLLNLLLGRSIDQGFLATLLTLHFLIHENAFQRSHENMTYFFPGIDVHKDNNHVCELDLFVVSEGEKIVGECKIGRDVTQLEINKLVQMGESIEADVALFSTLGEFSPQCVEQINEKAKNTKLKLVILQKDQLLNQMVYREIDRGREGAQKSYRQIFVERVTHMRQ